MTMTEIEAIKEQLMAVGGLVEVVQVEGNPRKVIVVTVPEDDETPAQTVKRHDDMVKATEEMLRDEI